MNRTAALVFSLLLALAVPAAGQAPPSTGDAGDAPTAPAPEPPAPTTGDVEGTVIYAGRAPLRIKQLTNDVDVETCGAKVRSDSVILARQGALANVFLELLQLDGEPLSRDLAPPADGTVVVDLRGCTVHPHVQVVPLGSRVEVLNSDGLLYELTTFSLRNPGFTGRLPRFRRRIVIGDRHFRRSEQIRVGCERHPFLSAWWIATDNPHHAVTGADGSYRIPDIPDGTYRLSVWHEQLGVLEQEITVTAGEKTVARLEYR